MKRAQNLVLLTLLILSTSFAWAWPPTYGAEFEMATPNAKKNGHNFDYAKYPPGKSVEKAEQMLFVEKIRERCVSLGCKVVEIDGKWDKDYRVEYADGWWFKVSYDPYCVEFTFKPSTLETVRAKAEIINDHIFGTGKMLGMEVTPTTSHHFNVGIRAAFNDSPKEFIKFYVDYANNPALTSGGLGNDLYNAPPLAALGADQRTALQEIVHGVEIGAYKTIAEVAKAIQEKVYTKSYYAPWGGPHHYQAFGLKYVNKTDLSQKDAPFELRSMWAQPDAETFIKIGELIEARIEFLRNSPQPLIYTETDKYAFSNDELKTRMFIYVEETGLKFSDFEFFMKDPIPGAKLTALVDSNAHIDDRLKDILRYKDLLTTSPYVRKLTLEILSHPLAKGSFRIEKIKDALRLEIEGGFMSYIDSLFKSDPKDDPKKVLLSNFLKEVEVAEHAYSCKMIFAH